VNAAPAAATSRDERFVTAGRWLAVLVMAGLMVSPFWANWGQLGLIVVFALSGHLRSRFAAACRQPLGAATLLLLLVIAAGVPFSAAGAAEGAKTLWGWRKLLLVPVGLALFETPAAKVFLLRAFATAAGVMTVLSYAAYFSGVSVFAHDPAPGIIARNHVTQGAAFCLGAFASAALAIYGLGLSRKLRLLHAAGAVLMISNVMAVTTGRTGYLVLLVCAVAMAAGWALQRGLKLRTALVAAFAASALLLAGLLTVPASRQGIDLAVSEMQTYQHETRITSMGIRIIFWRNTLELLPRHPIAGWGTGSFETAYKTRVQGVPGVAGTVTKDPHNQYLGILTEHGAIGLAVFLGFIASAFWQRPSTAFAVLGLGALAAWSATSMANSHFATFGEGTLLYTWLGALLAREREPPAA
jgi:O-antigen ligase